MATTDSNFFELMRRGFLWTSTTTLDDEVTPMTWDDDPNDVVNGNTDGESKLYAMPIGAFYMETDGTLWFKNGTPNTWEQVSIGAGSGVESWELEEAWDGSTSTKTYTVDGTVTPARGSVSDARKATWVFKDADNDYLQMDIKITATSATSVTVTADMNLPAGDYFLRGVQ